jgi:hypothetical protein
MQNLLFIIGVILALSWSICFIGYGAGGFVHVLIIFSFFALLLRGIREERNLN